MRIRMVKDGDGPGPAGERRALFCGQVYDLPADAAYRLIDGGSATADGEAEERPAKAVHGPPEDKALKPRRNRQR